MCVLEHCEQGVGHLGKLYEKLLRTAGLTLDDVYTTYQYKCPLRGAIPKAGQRDACKGWLWQELYLLRPKVIFAFGSHPTNLLLRKSIVLKDVVGKVFVEDYLPGGATKIIPMYSTHKLYIGSKDDVCDAADLLKEYT